jgi:hypothetical protein
MSRTFIVAVTIDVKVTVDEAKFDDAFMQEFRDGFYNFHDLDAHVEHLAQLEARGLLRDDFIEGYGPPKDMGIETSIEGWDKEIIEEVLS